MSAAARPPRASSLSRQTSSTNAPTTTAAAADEEGDTRYSIDFDALLGADNNDTGDITLDEPAIDVVNSEDVEGPSDFTQNMEFWMRGGRLPERGREEEEEEGGERVEDEDGAAAAEGHDEDADEGFQADDDETLPEVGEARDQGLESVDTSQAAAIIEDLEGYVVSDEEDSGARRPSAGSIDEQLDILSSMDDEEARRDSPRSSTPRSPHPRAGSGQPHIKQQPITPAKRELLQPTVEDHEDTPVHSRLNITPLRTPEVLVEDYEKLRRRPSPGPAPQQQTPRKPNQQNEDLRSQIRDLGSQLQRQQHEHDAKVVALESALLKTRGDLSEAKDNERHWCNAATQHHDRLAALDKQWKDHLSKTHQDYQRKIKDQEESFALVKSSIEARLSSSETEAQNRFAQKESELAAAETGHAQQLEQQRAGYESKLAVLEARIEELAQERDERPPRNDNEAEKQTPDSPIEQSSAHQKASSDAARIAELEATLSTTQAQLSNTRRDSLARENLARAAHSHTEALLARSKTQVSDLESSLRLLQSQLAQARRELSDLQADASGARDSARVLRDELHHAQSLIAHKTARLAQLLGDLEAEKTRARERRDADAAGGVEALQRLLAEQERTAEASIRQLEDQLRKEREYGGAEALQRQLAEQERTAEASIRQLEDQLRKARKCGGAEALQGQLAEQERTSDARIRQLEDQLRKAREEQKAKVDAMRRRAEDAVKRAGAIVQNQQAARASLAQELKAMRMEVEDVRAGTPAAADSAAQKELGRLRAALAEQSALAEAARVEADVRLALELDARRREYDDVNRAMDEKMVEAMRRREREWVAKEREWKQRVEGLVREKKKMGRALMQEWGKGERGEGRPQEYRYMFVRK
ncbi:hypothetical protein K490DRAFT_59412 [Saccharata proteae CBS 121410]|uniref:Uncharacterized protein n=1 Tax=Saccharata proteae CBS 121410 TaxID=1314787 RepID=A0A9P4HSQ7_9PEZI|nr:hypothetical protein K490DRAFT_59412 [Saccharata proteae CBS 121410]